jgi:hypothetical protein
MNLNRRFLRGELLGGSLLDLVEDNSAWSQATFGSDAERGPIGALKHLEEEAREAQAEPTDILEYADCLLLLLDATRRAGWSVEDLVNAAYDKMKVNKTRTFIKAPPDQPSHHLANGIPTR